MDKQQLLKYCEAIDHFLTQPATLYVYGSAAFMLLDESGRTSIDIDVAGPYSQADWADLRQAAEQAGLPVNPEETSGKDHLEIVALPRLCLPRPAADDELLLWQGAKLTIKSASAAQLVASKLIRYDEIDQSDMRYLCEAMRITFDDVAAAVELLPPHFRLDRLVRDNLENLKNDMNMWRSSP